MVNDPAGLAEADLGLLRMAVAKALLERETAEELMRELRSSTSVDLEQLLVTRGLLTAHSITMLRRDLTRSDGRTIGGFRLLTKLGKGGMGTVWRAHQISMDREVALKLLDPALANDRRFADRFLREAKAMGAITHPHVVSCHDAGKDGKHLFIALELMRGGDVAELQIKAGGQLPVRRALEIMRDAADGLQALHLVGLIHRDLKPANLFLTPEGRVKVADLGLARANDASDQMTATGAVVGTPAYMSPEQAQGVEVLDIRCDIYALGATLYTLLTGVAPYKGVTPFAVVAQVINDPFPDPRQRLPHLPKGVVDLILACTARDRSLRPSTPADVALRCRVLLADAHALAAPLPLVDASAPTITTFAASQQPAARSSHRRHIAWAMLVISLFALSFSAWRTWKTPRPQLDGWSHVRGEWTRLSDGTVIVHGAGSAQREETFAPETTLRIPMTCRGSFHVRISPLGLQLGRNQESGALALAVDDPQSVIFSNPWPLSANELVDLRLIRTGRHVVISANGRLIGMVEMPAGNAQQPGIIELTSDRDSEVGLTPFTTWTTTESAAATDIMVAQKLALITVPDTWLTSAGKNGARLMTVEAKEKLNTHVTLKAGQTITIEPHARDTWTCAGDAPGSPLGAHATADGYHDPQLAARVGD